MIRVTVCGPPVQGRYPYRVDTPGTRLAAPITGLSAQPIYAACFRLKELGAAADDAMVALFETGSDRIHRQTTVGYGANYGTSDVKLATPSESPLPPHKSPGLLTDTGPDSAAPSTSGKSRRRRSGGASGARRGAR